MPLLIFFIIGISGITISVSGTSDTFGTSGIGSGNGGEFSRNP